MNLFDLLILLLCLVINNGIIIFAKPREKPNMNIKEEVEKRFDEMFGTLENIEKHLNHDFNNESSEIEYIIENKANSKEILNALEEVLKVHVKLTNISTHVGAVYQTEKKQLIFVKESSKQEHGKKFYGEFESLKALRKTKTVYIPRPIATGHTSNKNQHFIAMEYMDISVLDDKTMGKLGSQLADMHMCNWQNKCGNEPAIKKFGFHVDTSIGVVAFNNTWTNDWITFFVENRMAYQIQLVQKNNGSAWLTKKIIEDYWPRVKLMIPKLFEGIEVKPSLLHGDLHSRNTAEYNLKPAIYDPASFYGHHEYDISSTILFSAFSDTFYDAYFKKIPKAKGFKKRMQLYHAYDYLNHWANLGCGYLELATKMFEKLLNVQK